MFYISQFFGAVLIKYRAGVMSLQLGLVNLLHWHTTPYHVEQTTNLHDLFYDG